MKLIVLSSSDKPIDEKDIIAEMFADKSKEEPIIATQMFENGLQTYHLRKPGYSVKELIEYIKEIPEKYHGRIILHSDHHLANRFSFKGIHLNKSAKEKYLKTWIQLKLLKLKTPSLLVSTSYSSASKLFEEEKFTFDYVFLSPIYNNLTGVFQSRIQESTLKSVMQRTQYKVVARGGISVDKVEQLKNIGFYGIAVHSTIWKRENPVEEFIRFKKKFEELGIPLE
jgi:thiamine-phosphate pyrophosphorylase